MTVPYIPYVLLGFMLAIWCIDWDEMDLNQCVSILGSGTLTGQRCENNRLLFYPRYLNILLFYWTIFCYSSWCCCCCCSPGFCANQTNCQRIVTSRSQITIVLVSASLSYSKFRQIRRWSSHLGERQQIGCRIID